MPAPTTYQGYGAGTWPADSEQVTKAGMRAFVGPTASKIGPMPEAWTGMDGELIAGNAAMTGPTAASLTGLQTLNTAGLGLVYPANSLPVTGTSYTPTMVRDCAADLMCANASAQTINLTLDSSGNNGVWTGFQCAIFRGGPGAVLIALGAGLSLQISGDNLHVQLGRPVALKIYGTKVWIWGYSAP